jgi:hypothetical protein
MTDPMNIDPKLVETYRKRRAPPGFAARVVARTSAPSGTLRLVWRSAAAVAAVAGAALVYVLATAPGQQPVPDMSVPPAPDYWAEISVPHDPPVSGLDDFGTVPLFPTRPDFDAATPDHRSMRPRQRIMKVSHTLQKETIHEAI